MSELYHTRFQMRSPGEAVQMLSFMSATQIQVALDEALAQNRNTLMFTGLEEEVDREKKAFICINPFEVIFFVHRKFSHIKDAMDAAQREQSEELVRRQLAGGGRIQ